MCKRGINGWPMSKYGCLRLLAEFSAELYQGREPTCDGDCDSSFLQSSFLKSVQGGESMQRRQMWKAPLAFKPVGALTNERHIRLVLKRLQKDVALLPFYVGEMHITIDYPPQRELPKHT